MYILSNKRNSSSLSIHAELSVPRGECSRNVDFITTLLPFHYGRDRSSRIVQRKGLQLITNIILVDRGTADSGRLPRQRTFDIVLVQR